MIGTFIMLNICVSYNESTNTFYLIDPLARQKLHIYQYLRFSTAFKRAICGFLTKVRPLPFLRNRSGKAADSVWNPPPCLHFFVDQEGIEPSSKQGKKMLSTCLSLSSFQPRCRRELPNHDLSSKRFRLWHEAAADYSRFAAPPFQYASGRQLLGDVPFQCLTSE